MDQEKKKKILIILLWSAAAVLLAGAVFLAIHIFQFKTYHDAQYKFKIQYPREWQKIEHFEGTVVTFLRPKQSALDVVTPNVNITVQEVPEHIASLKSFSETITNQMRAVFNNIQILDDSEARVADRPGHRLVVYAAKPSDLKMVFKWTIKGSFAYIFTFIATEKQYKELTPTVRRMVDSWRIQ